jgi:hypothetical protein
MAALANDLVLDWPLRGQVVLPFGSYERNGTEHFHYGIDISGSAGDKVLSPLDGTVAYLGKPPAAGGKLCLSLVFDQYRLTLFPLENSLVGQGDEVKRGMELGFLASQGDASSLSTHLHLGLRDGQGHYLDPLAFLKPLPATENTDSDLEDAKPTLTSEEPPSLKETVAPQTGGSALEKSLKEAEVKKLNARGVSPKNASYLSRIDGGSLAAHQTEKERLEFLTSLARLQAVITSLPHYNLDKGSFMKAFRDHQTRLAEEKKPREPSFNWGDSSSSPASSKLMATSLTRKVYCLLYWFFSLSLGLFLFLGFQRKRTLFKFAWGAKL